VRALLITMGVPVGYRVVISTPNRLTAECGTVGVIGDLQATAPRALWGRRTAALRPV
jgi:hypothetical protein